VRKPDYNRRVVVTGVGVVSPVGNDKDTAWSNLIRGQSGLGEITHFDASPYEHNFAITPTWMGRFSVIVLERI